MPTPEKPTDKQLLDFLNGQSPAEDDQWLADYLERHPAAIDQLESTLSSNRILSELRDELRFEREPEYQHGLNSVRSVIATLASPMVPARIGGFEIIRSLDQKRRGAVYVGKHPDKQQWVAIKLLNPDGPSDSHARERFEREICILKQLKHPGVVRFMQAGQEDRFRFIVTELLYGLDLSQLVHEHGRLPIKVACCIIHQVATTLQYVHENECVHRDIKPSNLFLTRDGNVKLLDLGLATLQSGGDGTLTESGCLLGTVDYMAPEQAFTASDADIRSDLYSLGCTLYNLLAGRAPFSGERYTNPLRKVIAHCDHSITPLDRFRDDIPQTLLLIVSKACAKKPDDRYQTPQQFADALNRFADDEALKQFATQALARYIHDATLADLNALACRESLGSSAPPVQPNRRYILLAGFGIFTVAGFAAWKYRDPSITVFKNSAIDPLDHGNQNPMSSTTPATMESAAKASLPTDPQKSSSIDRTVAIEVLQRGGLVNIKGRASELTSEHDLPEQDFDLICIKIRGTELPRKLLEDFAKLKQLNAIHLPGCRITGDAIRILTQNHNLELLWVYNNPLNNASVQAIAALPKLNSLNLNNTGITKIADLAPLQRLRSLYLGYLGLKDDQLRVLANFVDLERLHLPANPLTDQCVESLLQVSNLKELHLQGTRITNQGFHRLHEQFPDCAILR